ncbi:hypothetical protein EX30DRAFT_342630 [Ascodesmis nigricans]|uniref:DUF3074 domain-containing protein n=1 Tax=Ascodesmis nigricans TaxID=341454 RepID=A0A4S2MPP5_9PEZI|nr:hypothetical protein EX30DRAFT_342630 [Ascodesmis nigricans]
MAEVHEALKSLAPARHETFPRSRSTLDIHLANTLVDVHTLISSIPPPENIPPNLHLPSPPNTDAKILQKEWKLVKMSSKDNPLDISVFKLSAKDGRGAWFARRSMHMDIPFSRFKAGLQKEFDQPKDENGVEQGAIRGIGKNETIQDHESELGKAEVMVLSAQFPGPSAPRMFVEGYLTTSAHPEDLSMSNGIDSDESTHEAQDIQAAAVQRPKQFTIISKPVLDHPAVEDKPGHVLGQYESVEFIREVPLDPRHIDRSQSFPNVGSAAKLLTSPTRPRGRTVSGNLEDPNPSIPVEWIMITRSDPGGNVPRWMVERGTPNGIVKDAEKFIKWCREAYHLDETREASLEVSTSQATKGQLAHKDPEIRSEAQKHLVGQGARASTSSASTIVAKDHALSPSSESHKSFDSLQPPSEATDDDDEQNHSGGGVLSSLAAGVSSLANSAISSTTSKNNSHHVHTPPPSEPDIPTPPTTNFTDTDTATDPVSPSSSSASISSFATCISQDDVSRNLFNPDTPNASHPSQSESSSSSMTPESQALHQFLKEKAKLEEKLRREEAKRMEKERKITEKHLRNLEKRERKYRRAVEKAEEKKKREAEKVRRAKMEGDGMSGFGGGGHRPHPAHQGSSSKKEGWREVETLKGLVEELTRENLELKKRVEKLENEKMLLERELGTGGEDA